MQRMTEDEFNVWRKNKERIVSRQKSHFLPSRKYHNKPVTVNGIYFHSTKESDRYIALSLLEKSGAITKLERQPRFVLQGPFVYKGIRYRAIIYIADFHFLI